MATVIPESGAKNCSSSSASTSTGDSSAMSTATTQMGVPSSRPELRTLSASNIQTQGWLTTVSKNLQLCRSAIGMQESFCRLLQKTNSSTQSNYMFALENSIFDMASSGISEGSLYGIVFRDGPLKYFRFFESGIYKGFFETKGLELLKGAIPLRRETDFFWEKIFTDEDNDKAAQQYQQTLEEKRKKT